MIKYPKIPIKTKEKKREKINKISENIRLVVS